jgi:hypothetical protein
MAGGIQQPQLKPIEALLTGDKTFSVPKYQRNFSWTKDEVRELWEDTCSALDTDKEDFFLGTIVVRDLNTVYEIIDGQQRLACISMLFSAIRNAFLTRDHERAERVDSRFLGAKDFGRDAAPRPRLVLNEHNNPFFLRFVVHSLNSDEVTTQLKDKTLSESNALLLDAYRYFLDEIGTRVGKLGTHYDEFLEKLINCLRSSAKVIAIPVENEEDAYQLFESLNARGKDLAVSDLVKNRLYAEAGAQVTHAQQLWEKMEVDLVRRPIPEFLRHFWIARRAPHTELKVREKALYRTIVAQAKGQTRAIALLNELGGSAKNYAMIQDYSLWPNDPSYDKSFEHTIEDLKLFRVSQCFPVLLNAIEIFNRPQDIVKTFQLVANFSFRYNIIGGGTSGDLESVFGEIAYGIRTGTHSSPSHVADALRSANSDSKFRAAFDIAVIPKTKGKLARYILSKLNDHMGGPELIANQDPKIVNLEHILPQKPTASWRASFSALATPEDYVQRIGNLTLLTAKINNNIANKSFHVKQRLAFKKSKLKINESPKRVTKWGDKEIELRQKQLAKAALQVWSL